MANPRFRKPRPRRPLRRLLAACAVAALLAVAPTSARAETRTDGLDVLGDIIVVEPLSVSVVRKGAVRAIVVLRPNLEVHDQAERDHIAATMPRLRDAWLRALDIYIDNIDLGRPLDLDRISILLARSVEQLYGPDKANILISFASMRRV